MRDPIKVPGDVQKVRIEPYIPVKLSLRWLECLVDDGRPQCSIIDVLQWSRRSCLTC